MCMANLGRCRFIHPQKDNIVWLPPPGCLIWLSLTPRGDIFWPMHATMEDPGVRIQLVERDAHFWEFSRERLDLRLCCVREGDSEEESV